MNNSTSNPAELDFTPNTPIKNESRPVDKVSTPKNFINLSSAISNGNSNNSFKSNKKPFKSYMSDYDIKEENKQVNYFKSIIDFKFVSNNKLFFFFCSS